jgi:teichuronic acid biosynthesis glycosyltransferase TuaC
MTADPRPRVLVLARTFPNNILPTLGLWTRRLVRASRPVARPTVVSPVPWAPPGIPLEAYARYRRVLRERDDEGDPVHHPRVPAGPGTLLISHDARLGYPAIRRLADRLHGEQPFDLVHAHFIYPDGVMAARLGERYGIPVVTTEQSIWAPALERFPAIRRQVVAALPRLSLITGVSEAVRASLVEALGERFEFALLPNVVDESAFPAPQGDEAWDPQRILFVGLIRHVKGLDVLVRALALLRERRPSVKLRVVGATFYPVQEADWEEVQRLVSELELGEHVEFAGQASPPEVAAAMRASAVLALPSRREAFPAVLLEALASGTPVVATRCGGPEEVVTSEVGRLVPPEDPGALAAALDEMLTLRPTIDRARLRDHVVSRYGMAATGARIGEIYARVLASGAPPARKRAMAR